VNVEIKAAFVDRPECQETFVDSVRLVGVMDGVVRVELCATRPDEPRPPEPQTAKFYPVARLALTLPAAMNLRNFLSHHLTELEKQGLIKVNTASAATPKH
jgi:hypothetical protein